MLSTLLNLGSGAGIGTKGKRAVQAVKTPSSLTGASALTVRALNVQEAATSFARQVGTATATSSAFVSHADLRGRAFRIFLTTWRSAGEINVCTLTAC